LGTGDLPAIYLQLVIVIFVSRIPNLEMDLRLLTSSENLNMSATRAMHYFAMKFHLF
jgi:hypothetical protein